MPQSSYSGAAVVLQPCLYLGLAESRSASVLGQRHTSLTRGVAEGLYVRLTRLR